MFVNSFQPLLEGKDVEIDYDSGGEKDDDDDEEDDEDPFEDDDPFSNAPPPAENMEHSNPSSYSWCLMRYACIRLAQNVLERFLAVAGIEMAGKKRYKYIWGQLFTRSDLQTISEAMYTVQQYKTKWIALFIEFEKKALKNYSTNSAFTALCTLYYYSLGRQVV